jgi:tetratricopeptide (TPR) repeat protein
MLASANSATSVDLAEVETEARHLLLQGDSDEARAVLQEARERCQQAQDLASAGALLRLLGDLEWSLDRFEAALRNYEQAQILFRRLNQEEDEADVLLHISDARARLGTVAGAQEACQAATAIYEALDKPLELAHCHFKLGELLRRTRTHTSSAEQHFVRAEELYDQVQKLDAQSFRVENPPLPETVDDCRTIEPWIMLEVVRRELAILRGQVAPPKKRRTVRKTETPVEVAAPATKPWNRDLIACGIVVAVVTAVFGALVLTAKLATPMWLPLGKVPFFIVGLIAAGVSALLVRASDIQSKTLSRSLPVVVGLLVFFGSSMAFEKPSDGATEVLVADAFIEPEIDLVPETVEVNPDAKRLEIEALLNRYAQAGDRRGEADTLVELALLERAQKQNERALTLYSRSYALYRGLNASALAAAVAVSMGEIFESGNRPADARQQYLDAAKLYAQLGDAAKQADALMKLGDVERTVGRSDAARKAYLESFALVASSNDVAMRVEILLRLAQAEADLNRLADAGKACQKAVALAQQTDDTVLQSKAWLALGEIESVAGRMDTARGAFEQSAQLAGRDGDPIRQVVIWQRLGNFERAAKRLPEASQAYRHALQAAEQSGDRDEQAATLLLLAQTDADLGKLDEARSGYTQAMAIYSDLGKDTGRGHAAIGLGDLEVKQNRADDARDTYRLALRFYEAGGSTTGQIDALERLSEVVARADPTLAKSYAARASGLRKRL